MLAAERRNHILEKLHEEKKVVVSELSHLFGVSEETIRRDLERLEKEGLAAKSYGGAVLNENIHMDYPTNVRKKQNVEGKKIIADLAAGLIHDGDHIMLDASSTVAFVAKALKKKRNLTVVTNSIEAILEFSDMADWTVLSSGGRLKGSYLALVGARAVEGVTGYHADKAVISCKALHASQGFSDSNDELAQVKRAMLSASGECILAVDSTKLNRLAFARIGNLRDIDILVTDRRPDERMFHILREAKVRCLYPGWEAEEE